QAGHISVADGATGMRRRSWLAHGNGVLALSLTRDGARLFSLGGDRGIKVWHARPGPIRFFDGHTGPVRTALFSPHGNYLLSCGGWPEGDRTLRLWDVRTGKQLRLLMTGEGRVEGAAFSPDGTYAAGAEETGTIHLFEVNTGNKVRTFRGHQGEISQVT